MSRKVYETRSSNAKERAKYMIWTNEMDHFLANILAEHATENYKSDTIIKPSTYTAVVAALNVKFGLLLNKDHIKNRLKTLRKQHAVLKEIVAQKGFRWDKDQKMIVANDAAWKEYIKVNPDAKPFRAKVIENYDALCSIAGNDQGITSFSDNDTDVYVDLMFDSEVVNPVIDCEVQSDDKQIKNMRWTEEMDTCLGKVLAEQVQKGYKVGNILQSEAYEAAVTALNGKFGSDITKDHVKNRLRTWRKQHIVLCEILSHGGFKWDESQKLIVGDDSLWNDYIKVHQDARLLRGKVIENYDQLFIIFGNSNFVGRYSRNSDGVVHTLAVESERVGPIDASPIRCWSTVRDEVKNMRWTREMDHCLSKVLVEQVKLGNKNKLDNKLKTAAYDSAVSALNERFHLDFTKDHVKNRIKTWKKLYGNVKELLEQKGFKWDKSQKMIIADDSIWHAYVKVNPDARVLHGRVIWNYDDLSIIIGNDDPAECSGNDTQMDLDWAAENARETVSVYQNQGNNEEGTYMVWTDEMDQCLSEILLRQVKLGNKLRKNFKSVAYAAAVDALNEKFVLDLTVESVKSHVKTWQKLYYLVKKLLCVEGFEWDERKKMVVASDSVWDDHIKTNPDVASLRGRCIKNYCALHAIVGNELVNGWQSVAGPKSGTNLAGEHAEVPVPINLKLSPLNSCEEGTEGSSHRAGGTPSSSSRSKQPSKRSRSDVMIEMMSAIAANIGRIADALTVSNQSVCLDELFDIVQNIPGFDDDLIIEACEFLSFDEKRAKMFLKLDERLRKMWLLKRLRGHTC
ncbi:hypothetical protein Pfo_017835 [Paulownia fortunei]|nr:hypothetical protein Pfo_017835 [Paulownia fortunei]